MMRACLRVAWALWVIGLTVIAACSREEKLYRVSGNVTFVGKPIPKGLIFFDPQAEGPQGFANIVEGKYDTTVQGKGVRGGSYNIRVNGFDGKQVNDAPFGNTLFPEYTGTTELPSQDSTFDLDIQKK